MENPSFLLAKNVFFKVSDNRLSVKVAAHMSGTAQIPDVLPENLTPFLLRKMKLTNPIGVRLKLYELF